MVSTSCRRSLRAALLMNAFAHQAPLEVSSSSKMFQGSEVRFDRFGTDFEAMTAMTCNGGSSTPRTRADGRSVRPCYALLRLARI